MRRSLLLIAVVACLVAMFGRIEAPVNAQASGARSWSVPRTPWGHPDLQGT